MIAECFRAFLAADLTPRIDGLSCWDRIGAYLNGGDNKAAFCFDPPPVGAEVNLAAPRSFIVTIVESPGEPGPIDTRAQRGIQQRVTVRVYSAKSFSHRDLCDMAYALSECFHHAEIVVPGWENGGCWADAPHDSIEPKVDLPAYRFDCRILLRQSPATTTAGP